MGLQCWICWVQQRLWFMASQSYRSCCRWKGIPQWRSHIQSTAIPWSKSNLLKRHHRSENMADI